MARVHPAQSTAEAPDGWPQGVVPISMEGMVHLGVGEDGALYWDGKPVEVRRGVSFTVAQNILAWAVAGSAIIGAVATCVSAYAALAAIPHP